MSQSPSSEEDEAVTGIGCLSGAVLPSWVSLHPQVSLCLCSAGPLYWLVLLLCGPMAWPVPSLECATNLYEPPPAWGQTKATDLPCQPWASLDLSAWQCRAGPD